MKGKTLMWLHSTVRYYFIKPEEIHYLTFILEAYEGVAVVTTIDRIQGLIMLQISPGQEDVVDAIISEEGDVIGIRALQIHQEVPRRFQE